MATESRRTTQAASVKAAAIVTPTAISTALAAAQAAILKVQSLPAISSLVEFAKISTRSKELNFMVTTLQSTLENRYPR